MIAFKAEYGRVSFSVTRRRNRDAQFFKFDQLPEIPLKAVFTCHDACDRRHASRR